MAHAKDVKAELFWSYARLGYESTHISGVLASQIRINPLRPPYPQITVYQIPEDKEVELLIRRNNDTWMKVQAMVHAKEISYRLYRTNGLSDMLDALSAIRQQNVESAAEYSPFRESLVACSSRFYRVYQLPELSDWEKAKAREWLEAQITPGTPENLFHLRALENNYTPDTWVPLQLRLRKDPFQQGAISMDYMLELADEAEREARLSVLEDKDRVSSRPQPQSLWERIKSFWQ